MVRECKMTKRVVIYSLLSSLLLLSTSAHPAPQKAKTKRGVSAKYSNILCHILSKY